MTFVWCLVLGCVYSVKTEKANAALKQFFFWSSFTLFMDWENIAQHNGWKEIVFVATKNIVCFFQKKNEYWFIYSWIIIIVTSLFNVTNMRHIYMKFELRLCTKLYWNYTTRGDLCGSYVLDGNSTFQLLWRAFITFEIILDLNMLHSSLWAQIGSTYTIGAVPQSYRSKEKQSVLTIKFSWS